jgi:hypothetical protein
VARGCWYVLILVLLLVVAALSFPASREVVCFPCPIGELFLVLLLIDWLAFFSFVVV